MEAHYSWDIDNFPTRAEAEIISPSFPGIWDGHRVEWHLKMCPDGYNYHFKGYVSIFLYLDTEGLSERDVWFTVSCMDSSDDVVQVGESTYPITTKFPRSGGFGTYSLLKRNTILSEKNHILIDGHKLRIHCCVSGEPEMPFCLDIGYTDALCNCKNSNIGLWELYQQQKLVDCTISVGNKDFRLHKALLVGRSEVFAAMFENEFKEKSSSSVRIEDFEPKVIEALINFIYLDDVKDVEEVSPDLLLCAEKYGLTKLKLICARTLARNLSVDTVAHVLTAAHLSDFAPLKARAVSYIVEHWREVLKTADWTMLFNHKDIVVAIFEEMSIK